MSLNICRSRVFFTSFLNHISNSTQCVFYSSNILIYLFDIIIVTFVTKIKELLVLSVHTHYIPVNGAAIPNMTVYKYSFSIHYYY